MNRSRCSAISAPVAAMRSLVSTVASRIQPISSFATAAVSIGPDTPQGLPGLLEGNPNQLLLQLYGVLATLIWSGVITFVLLKLIALMVPLRVSPQSEIEGLDVTQHGEALQ